MATVLRQARGRRHERGAALVEFAVVSIVFFTFVFGVTEFGRMIFDYNIISTATRDGARWAAVRGTASGTHEASDTDVENYVVSRSLGRVVAAEVTVTWPDVGGNRPGNRVVVAVTHNFASSVTTLVPFASIPLNSTTSMVISR